MIKPETFAFLTAIGENNDREWFAVNKDSYEAAKQNVIDFIEELIPILAATDPSFPLETQAKKCLLRIYRDVRFSKNKAPYKNNFGISFAVKKQSGQGPEYYLHLQPGKSFLAAGYWMPEAPLLKSIREEIDYNTSEFLEIVKNFEGTFTLSREDSLKRAPKGYDPDHEHIDLLKLKSFMASFPISDAAFLKADIFDKLGAAFKTIYPLVQFLRKA